MMRRKDEDVYLLHKLARQCEFAEDVMDFFDSTEEFFVHPAYRRHAIWSPALFPNDND